MYIQSSSNKISSDQYTICVESLLPLPAINSAAKPKMELFSELNYGKPYLGQREQNRETEKQAEEKAGRFFLINQLSRTWPLMKHTGNKRLEMPKDFQKSCVRSLQKQEGSSSGSLSENRQ